MKPGDTLASSTPRINRTVTAPAKLVAAARDAMVIPQATMQNAEYLAKGSL